MKLTDEAFHLIKNTPKVTGFLGAENKPMPISEAEAMRILHQVQEGVERPKASVSFEIGENVRVADGPFASFSGVVEEIDEARSRVKVAVSIFGAPRRSNWNSLRSRRSDRDVIAGSRPGMTKAEAATLPNSRGRKWMIASHPLNRTTVL